MNIVDSRDRATVMETSAVCVDDDCIRAKILTLRGHTAVHKIIASPHLKQGAAARDLVRGADELDLHRCPPCVMIVQTRCLP